LGLADPDKDVRGQAILAILNIGLPAKEAVPSVEEAQKDRDPTIRAYATKALERIRGR
jgi:HEAT repeat protein